MTAADLLVLAPWLIFGPASRRSAITSSPAAAAGDRLPRGASAGSGVRHPRMPATDPPVTGISPGRRRNIHPSSIAWTSPLRIGGLPRRQGLIARPRTTMR